MRRLLTLLLILTLAFTLTPPPPASALPQEERGGAKGAQDRELPSGKLVGSWRRGQSGARPAWVETALARSLAHLRSEGAPHDLANADAELALLSVVADDLGQTHVRLEQVHRGVPVFGGQLIAHLDAPDPASAKGAKRTFANGRVFKDARQVSTRARITAADALAAAKRALGRDAGFAREGAELVVLPEAVRRGDDASGATLVYKVELLVNDGREAARHFYFIDARDGSVVWHYDNLQKGLGHGLYSGQRGIGTVFNGWTFEMRDPGRTNGSLCGAGGIITSDAQFAGPCSPYTDPDDVWGNSQPFDIQSAAVDAHLFAALTFDYFLGYHGRNSIDGAGMQMCNRMRHDFFFGPDNAFWDGQCTNYGSGSNGRHLATADVVGHEYTHGVTEFSAGLIYSGQSGGSNESFSDIFGTRVEFLWGVNPDYRIAEDWNGFGFRNMANPREDGHSIDHLSQYFNGMGVHSSSGLQNVVFYLLSESGHHPTTGVFVKRIGRDRAAAVFYRALVVYLFPSATFADVRQATELATRDLYSTGNPIWNALRKGWFSAGVGGDVPFNAIDNSTDFVAWHYRDFLNREPDGGLWWWAGQIDQCGPDAACEDGMRVNVSRAFWDSGEFQSRPDVQASGLLTGNPSHPYDNAQFVRWCYLNYLRREPDPWGWQFWLNGLNSHGDYNAIIRAFLLSGEYRQRFGTP
ncbi:MAG TPA: M4 family metallopeptidase [Pyrinomonadaceae bacterium]|nr:M4 family metallopeptidase [Pyrinomonadaceae bacterium]